MSRPLITVVVCTHNPKTHYLTRVVESLQKQTLRRDHWELLVVDNASQQPLSKVWDLSWHVNARHIREEELGLTPARLRGIEESRGELIIFVDDDNLLCEDYLTVALDIFDSYWFIGAFGGSVKAEYEMPPSAEILPYVKGLAVGEVDRDFWSNLRVYSEAVPFGAGLCVRRKVADEYLQKAQGDPRRKLLGRCGAGMGSGEDTDLAWCSVDLGMGTGRFCRLRLTHLIPRARVLPEYIKQLYAGFAASSILLESFRDVPDFPKGREWGELPGFLWRLMRSSHFERELLLAQRRARRTARQLLVRSTNLAKI